jgi:NAD-dependent DNA ligase
MIVLANTEYYNTNEPLMTDNEYDIIKEFTEKKYPNNNTIKEIGAVVERNKVTLPYSMGSMDKIKPDTNSLNIWCKTYKGPYVLSCKLDGVSGLYTTEDSSGPKLYTRGDGKVGQDISHLIPYLRLPITKGVVIRGEFIIPKQIFETKYKHKFANPRNMVAGIINLKTISEVLHDLHFVAYEVIKPIISPSEQMKILSKMDIECVLYKIETILTNELLSQTLIEWREKYGYEIDGVIVSNDSIYERKFGNPEHAFAFKMVLSEQIAEAKVVDVIWTPSKDGYLKPRVQIEPINLCGVRIEYATGFNASFINDNKVGVGATIEIIRSGDVIPHIRKVIIPASEPKMPSVPYKWNNTNIDILLQDISLDETVREKNITCFFKGIAVEGLSSGNISRIIQCGFDTVPKIIKMSIDDFLKVEGIKEKLSSKLYNGIREKLKAASLVTIMSSSNIFGRGFNEKKIELIMNSLPDILLSNDTNEIKIQKISAIKGMAYKTAEAFVEGIEAFKNFIKEAGLSEKLLSEQNISTIEKSHPLYGKSVIMTGFRDKELEVNLKNVGAKISSSVSKNTFVVIVKDTNSIEDTGKIIDAKKLGIPIITQSDFIKKYL